MSYAVVKIAEGGTRFTPFTMIIDSFGDAFCRTATSGKLGGTRERECGEVPCVNNSNTCACSKFETAPKAERNTLTNQI